MGLSDTEEVSDHDDEEKDRDRDRDQDRDQDREHDQDGSGSDSDHPSQSDVVDDEEDEQDEDGRVDPHFWAEVLNQPGEPALLTTFKADFYPDDTLKSLPDAIQQPNHPGCPYDSSPEFVYTSGPGINPAWNMFHVWNAFQS